MRLAELGFNDSPVRRAFELRDPDHRGVRPDRARSPCSAAACRSSPAERSTGGAAAAPRRHRGAQAGQAAALEGRDDPRDPPPGQEQPADDLVAAAPAGASARDPEAKAAVNESVRRIRTIALVHETLSREPGDDVAFIEIVRPLLRLAEEGSAVTRSAGPLHGAGRRRAAPGHHRDTAVGRAHRVAAERHRPRLPGGQPRRRRRRRARQRRSMLDIA